MNFTIKDVLHNMIVESLSHLTYPELSERLAMFFRHYMPLSALAFYVYYDRKVVKIAEYAFTDVSMGPDKAEFPQGLLEEYVQEPAHNDDFDIHIQTEDSAIGKMHALVHTSPSTSLHVPLTFYKNRMLYMSITAYGQDRYGTEHVDLCRLVRPALIMAMGNTVSSQRIDLRDREALEKLERFDGPNAVPVDVSGNEHEEFLPLDEYMVNYIQRVLRHTRGRVAGKNGAAVLLGMHVSTLWSKIRKFHIPVPKG